MLLLLVKVRTETNDGLKRSSPRRKVVLGELFVFVLLLLVKVRSETYNERKSRSSTKNRPWRAVRVVVGQGEV